MGELKHIPPITEEEMINFRFYGCTVAQLTAALDFYASLTGFRVHGRSPETIRDDARSLAGALARRGTGRETL